MSSRSESHRGNVVVSVSELPVVTTPAERSVGEVSGRKEVLKHHEAVMKCLGPISENVRNKARMSPHLQIYSNSEYVYATFPIALSLFWGKGGGEICLSRPLSVIFIILSRCLYTTASNNYYVRTHGQWSCDDAIQQGHVPLAPLDDWEKYPNGSNPRVSSGTAPETFYYEDPLFFWGGPELMRGSVAMSRKIRRPTDFRGRYLRNSI